MTSYRMIPCILVTLGISLGAAEQAEKSKKFCNWIRKLFGSSSHCLAESILSMIGKASCASNVNYVICKRRNLSRRRRL